MKIFRSILTSFSRVYVFSNRNEFLIRSNASGLLTLLFFSSHSKFLKQMYTQTQQYFLKTFCNLLYVQYMCWLLCIYFCICIACEIECEIGLRREKIIEQNDTDTTQIIAYALSFIIYANAWSLVGKFSHQLLKESCNHPSFFT